MPTIEVVGLGAGGLDLMPRGVYRRLRAADRLFLRTAEHPAAAELRAEGITFVAFDSLYRQHDTFEAVYEAICHRLLDEARRGDVLYAVPGHPMVAERTVQLLLERGPAAGVRVVIGGGQSFLDPLFALLGIDPIEGLAVLDGTALRREHLAPHLHLVITQVYDAFVAADVKLTLMEVYPDDYPVTVVTAVGVPQREKVEQKPLYLLDRLATDNLTLVYVPPTDDPRVINRRFDRLREVVAILRGPEGCPWDREQTHRSIRKNVIEEAYEVAQAIDDGDPDALCEELGDLLLQVMLHAQMAEEEGIFTVDDVIGGLVDKLIRRHPHVFGDRSAESAEEALANWEAMKQREAAAKGKGDAPSLLDSVPRALPALLKAWKIQKKAASVGFDWTALDDVFAKVEEEVREVREAAAQGRERAADEVGDLLFAVVNLARFLHVDPEEALARTCAKFARRFRHIEARLRAEGRTFADVTLAEMDRWWNEAKENGQ